MNFKRFQLFFSDSRDGNLSLTYGSKEAVLNNREAIFKKHKVDKTKLKLISTSHSSNILTIDNKGRKKIYRKEAKVIFDIMKKNRGYDGLIAFNNISVGLLTGDCIPLIVVDSKTNLHGIIHIGILGLINNIAQNLIPIVRDFNTDFCNLSFYIGPSIRGNVYDLSKSGLWPMIQTKYPKESRLLNDYITIRNASEFFSMQDMLVDQLLSIGAEKSIITDSEICTTKGYFSNFSAKNSFSKNGRFISIVSGIK